MWIGKGFSAYFLLSSAFEIQHLTSSLRHMFRLSDGSKSSQTIGRTDGTVRILWRGVSWRHTIPQETDPISQEFSDRGFVVPNNLIEEKTSFKFSIHGLLYESTEESYVRMGK